jgi:predicted MPP superfamily phosphohydrolase
MDAPGGTARRVHGAGAEMARVEHSVHALPMAGLTTRLTVLQVSDVHLRADATWAEHTSRAIAQAASDAPPDVLVLTGDVITRGWDEAMTRRWMDALPRPRLGTYAVMGNWEHWGGAPPARWEPLCADHGVRLLRDVNLPLGPVTLVGTEDLLAGPAEPDRAFDGMPTERPALVLSHSPAIFPAMVTHLRRLPSSLTLSGHTHGGQVRLPFVGPFFLPRGSGAYPWGWYRDGAHHLFVHRGMGWSVAPVRWRALPEVATLHLLPA